MRIELTHDLLAKKINDTVSVQFKARAHAKRIIELKYSFFLTNKTLLLSEAELKLIEPYLEDLMLNEGQQTFLHESLKAQQKKSQSLQIRNIINIVSVVIIIALMFIITQYQRSLKRHEQNKHLAGLVIRLLQQINEIKTNHSLAAAKEKADSIGTHFAQDPLLADFFNSNDPEVDSLKQNISVQTLNIKRHTTLSDTKHKIYAIKGKAVDNKGKSINNTKIFWKGDSAYILTDEGGYFEILLDNSLLSTAPTEYQTLVFEAEGHQSLEISQLPEKLRTLPENTSLLDLDKVILEVHK